MFFEIAAKRRKISPLRGEISPLDLRRRIFTPLDFPPGPNPQNKHWPIATIPPFYL